MYNLPTDEPPRYELEKVLFTAAAEGLRRAREKGIFHKSGSDALLAAMYVRSPKIYAERKMRANPEVAEYIHDLGAVIELAVEITETVDQQR